MTSTSSSTSESSSPPSRRQMDATRSPEARALLAAGLDELVVAAHYKNTTHSNGIRVQQYTKVLLPKRMFKELDTPAWRALMSDLESPRLELEPTDFVDQQ